MSARKSAPLSARADTIDALEYHGASLVAVADALRRLTLAHHDVNPPTRASDAVRSSNETVADPVAKAATSTARLVVHAALIACESALAVSADLLAEATATAERALEPYASASWRGLIRAPEPDADEGLLLAA